MALNPRGSLYKGRSLIEITHDVGNDGALNRYATLLHSESWALYRVRRIFLAKATADRAVEVLTVYENEDAAIGGLRAIAASLGRAIEMSGGIPYVWCERRSETEYPTREEFMTVAPAVVATKARHGIPRFEQKWSAMQLPLFSVP
jgi:hypothetical protein